MKQFNLKFVIPLIALALLTAGCAKDPKGDVIPLAPSELKALPASETVVGLSWKDNSNNESGFRVERKSGEVFSLMATVGKDVTTYSDLSLQPGTAYTYRVQAYNKAGNSLTYSNEATGTTPGVADVVGNIYKTVQIGTQLWMAENLKTVKYANGDVIPNVTDLTSWSALATGAWSNYNNDPSLDNPYGKLYNWYAVADPRNVCPTGWHVPTEVEWTLLKEHLGGEAVAGGKSKATGTLYWNDPNVGATNESGFNALAGGYRAYDVNFSHKGIGGYFWSSTEFDGGNAWVHGAVNNVTNFFPYNNGLKNDGFSVRCLKN